MRINMNKLAISLLTIALLSISFPNSAYAFKTCEEKGDDCIERCNDNWTGDTFADGIGRNACRAGCTIAEAGCIIGEWFQ